MKIHRISIPFRPTKHWKYRLVFAGDFHFGGANCAESLIAHFAKKYQSPSGDGCAPDGVPTSIFLLGDELDVVNAQDVKRYDPRMLHPRYRGDPAFLTTIANDFVEFMRPLKGQIVGGVMSNHLSHMVKIANVDLMDPIRKELGFENLGYSSYVVIQWKYYGREDGGSASTVLWLSHNVSCQTGLTISRASSMEKAMKLLADADIVVMGHTHELLTDSSRTVERLANDYSKIYSLSQHLIMSGNFLLTPYYDATGWAPYDEQKGLHAGRSPGWAVAEITFPPGSRSKLPRINCSVLRFKVEAGEGGTKVIID